MEIETKQIASSFVDSYYDACYQEAKDLPEFVRLHRSPHWRSDAGRRVCSSLRPGKSQSQRLIFQDKDFVVEIVVDCKKPPLQSIIAVQVVGHVYNVQHAKRHFFQTFLMAEEEGRKLYFFDDMLWYEDENASAITPFNANEMPESTSLADQQLNNATNREISTTYATEPLKTHGNDNMPTIYYPDSQQHFLPCMEEFLNSCIRSQDDLPSTSKHTERYEDENFFATHGNENIPRIYQPDIQQHSPPWMEDFLKYIFSCEDDLPSTSKHNDRYEDEQFSATIPLETYEMPQQIIGGETLGALPQLNNATYRGISTSSATEPVKTHGNENMSTTYNLDFAFHGSKYTEDDLPSTSKNNHISSGNMVQYRPDVSQQIKEGKLTGIYETTEGSTCVGHSIEHKDETQSKPSEANLLNEIVNSISSHEALFKGKELAYNSAFPALPSSPVHLESANREQESSPESSYLTAATNASGKVQGKHSMASVHKQTSRSGGTSTSKDPSKIFVRNLPSGITLINIYKKFRIFGDLCPGDIKIYPNRTRNRPVCAAVKFKNVASAQNAIEASVLRIDDQMVYIERFSPPRGRV